MNLCKIKGCLKPVGVFQNGYCEKHGRQMDWMERNEVKDVEEENIEKEYKGKYLDERYGTDSFMSYLSYVIEFNSDGNFVTTNENMIKDRKKLEKKFGIKIIQFERGK